MSEKRQATFDDDPRDVLVGVVRTTRDLRIVADEGWYRIPVASAPRSHWPPRIIAIYESAAVSNSGGLIRRFAEVRRIEVASREELFPGEPAGDKGGKLYHRIELGERHELKRPIVLTRPRPLSFINTTFRRLQTAETVNDLYSDSPLEDLLWKELKEREMPAERQWRETLAGVNYVLDFAMFCEKGKINVETDGDTYHTNPKGNIRDNDRNNDLEVIGWRVLRFNGPVIRERMADCISKITAMVQKLGGFESDGLVPRRWYPSVAAVQLSLGESAELYDPTQIENEDAD